ncbi:MAG: hypothetical protein JWP01_1800 [Myxococcales bacterium]|nr:hypothetical protein [Myxococcales bacterium]
MAIQFKFVELSIVTDETLGDCVNEWVAKSWQLEGIRFVMSEHSKRPSMAFVSFTREALQEVVDRDAPRKPRPLVAMSPPGPGDDHEDEPLPPLVDPKPPSPDRDKPYVITAGHDDVE